MGHPTTRFLASDGGSNSQLWMQICSDILQQPIQLLNGHPGSCLGAAWMAALGTGLTDDWQGVTRFVQYGGKVEPNAVHAKMYDHEYKLFRNSYQALAAIQSGSPS